MILSRPAPRELLHARDIRCRGYRRQDGLWDIDAELVDTKTYSFANHDREGINSGEPIHHMLLRLTVDDDLVVQAAEAATAAGPFSICGDITPVFASLVGLRIAPGWRRHVLERMAGSHGCTHLTDLLLGPLTATVLQTVSPARNRRQQAPHSGQRPAIIDSCHALASSSPVVQRQWPEFYTGTREDGVASPGPAADDKAAE
jgi:hypothetical protein